MNGELNYFGFHSIWRLVQGFLYGKDYIPALFSPYFLGFLGFPLGFHKMSCPICISCSPRSQNYMLTNPPIPDTMVALWKKN